MTDVQFDQDIVLTGGDLGENGFESVEGATPDGEAVRLRVEDGEIVIDDYFDD